MYMRLVEENGWQFHHELFDDAREHVTVYCNWPWDDWLPGRTLGSGVSLRPSRWADKPDFLL